MKLDFRPILHAILEEYVLPINGDHGVTHWASVLENGLKLSQETSANVEVLPCSMIPDESMNALIPITGNVEQISLLSFVAGCSKFLIRNSTCFIELVSDSQEKSPSTS